MTIRIEKILLALFLLIIIGCENDIQSRLENCQDENWRFLKNYMHLEFKKLLTERKVKFKEEKGYIIYCSKDSSIVKEIIGEIVKEESSGNHYFITDSNYLRMLIAELNGSNINFKIEEKGDAKKIIWGDNDDKAVKEISKRLHIIYTKKIMERKDKRGR